MGTAIALAFAEDDMEELAYTLANLTLKEAAELVQYLETSAKGRED